MLNCYALSFNSSELSLPRFYEVRFFVPINPGTNIFMHTQGDFLKPQATTDMRDISHQSLRSQDFLRVDSFSDRKSK